MFAYQLGTNGTALTRPAAIGIVTMPIRLAAYRASRDHLVLAPLSEVDDRNAREPGP